MNRSSAKTPVKSPATKSSPTTLRGRVRFLLVTTPGSQVHVAGTFNGWSAGKNPLRTIQNDGVYFLTMFLPKGCHEYKFIVNGHWQTDPQCPQTISNACGSQNSVIQV